MAAIKFQALLLLMGTWLASAQPDLYCGDKNCYDGLFGIEIHSEYAVLGVEPTASGSEIRKAYRTLSLQLHPDKNKVEYFRLLLCANHQQDSDAPKQFQEIVTAYEVCHCIPRH